MKSPVSERQVQRAGVTLPDPAVELSWCCADLSQISKLVPDVRLWVLAFHATMTVL